VPTTFLCYVSLTDTLFLPDTPSTHAVAFGRADVVKWILKRQSELDQNDCTDESLAYSLAKDFVMWTDPTDTKRRDVPKLFQDDDWSYYITDGSDTAGTIMDEDGNDSLY